MNKELLYGPDIFDLGWVPAPRYVLRRQRVLDAIDRVKPRNVLEIGCGPGVMLSELSRRGIDCTALETSAEAREIGAALHKGNSKVAFHDTPKEGWDDSFDLVMACEVLKHIDDDLRGCAVTSFCADDGSFRKGQSVPSRWFRNTS